jgi:hypothetical protein
MGARGQLNFISRLLHPRELIWDIYWVWEGTQYVVQPLWNKLHGLSPRANYTDRAKWLPTFVPRGQRDGSLRPYSRFSRQEPLLFYQVAPHLYSRGCVDPVPDPLLFSFPPPPENLVVPGIEPGPPDL